MGYIEPKMVDNPVHTKHEFGLAIWNWKETPSYLRPSKRRFAVLLPWRKRKVG